MTPASAPKTISSFHKPNASYILSAYYPSWRIYKGCKPSDLPLRLLTHVHYAFARFDEDGTVHHLDEKADTQLAVDGVQGCLAALKEARNEQNPDLKIVLSIGGGSGSAHFPSVAADAMKTARFCRTALDMLLRFGLDGLDIDWEHPKTLEQGRLFENLLRTLRGYLAYPTYSLTAALPVGEWCLKHIDLASLSNKSGPDSDGGPVLDHIMLMCYDFAGPWTDGQSGHHAQLRAPLNPHNAFAKRSIEEATRYLLNDQGVDPAKIVIGIPAYGQSFLGVKGPGEKFTGCGGDGDGTFEYRDLPIQGSVESVDRVIGAASCLSAEGWISYDNPETVRLKASFVRQKMLGGVFFWTGSSDTMSGGRSLVVAAHNALSAAT